MENKTIHLGKALYLGAFLMFGCSSGGVFGCGSSSSGPTVDSELLGVYRIDRYQGSEQGCDSMTDIDNAPGFLVLYSFHPNDKPDEARLGGVFCSGVDDCRLAAKQASEPLIGYSFLQGSDASGWLGWAIPNGGPVNDQCRAEVQAHVLTATGDTIDLQTKTFETVFAPRPEDIDGSNITCRNADAIAALDDRPPPPCKQILDVGATREAGL